MRKYKLNADLIRKAIYLFCRFIVFSYKNMLVIEIIDLSLKKLWKLICSTKQINHFRNLFVIEISYDLKCMHIETCVAKEEIAYDGNFSFFSYTCICKSGNLAKKKNLCWVRRLKHISIFSWSHYAKEKVLRKMKMKQPKQILLTQAKQNMRKVIKRNKSWERVNWVCS